ncbi:TonB-dependent receptor domain-containing protein [Novosphingobium piscinae]|uniref:TonB-dependent receptor n=1 Tax=Novosphingobium piscinae TaxID=1507448 RepID=A0A7X1FVH7_9SPHN|nr:TonB-dependent receptor [Novosphingobium piscinae]MBC2667745.1 TonB-dependent receptor [Novosphingobium piscinae]
MKSFQSLLLATSCIMPIMAASAASAQTVPTPADAAETPTEEIVVTGTLIRGTQVTGSQTISVGREDIQVKGATTTNELLGVIPQIANTFNGRFEGDPRGFSSGISITKPNLRNVPSSNQTSGALTLVLIDGMRATPVGVGQAAIDVDLIPAVIMAGIDVVTDGGSSLYGADAVAGVLNFRTLPKFDGIKVDANASFGTTIKRYQTWNGSILAGKSWNSGNAYIAFNRDERTEVVNRDVPWNDPRVYNAAGVGSFTFTQCATPVGTEARWFRFGPGAAQFTNNPAAPGAGPSFPVGSPCDGVSASTYLPKQTRTNVYGKLTQTLSDSLELRVTAYWSKRDTEFSILPRGFTAAGSPLTTGALVGAAFPNAAVGSITAVPGGTSFSFAPNAAYVNAPNRVGFETWGVSPELTWAVTSDWQVRANAHFGKSVNYQAFPNVDTVKAQCYITGCTGVAAGQLNPFNVGAASAAVITDILNYENAQDMTQKMLLMRAVADGPLFPLPGGDAKLAVGLEYQKNWAATRLTAGPVGSIDALPFRETNRNAKSFYGELSLPVTSFATVNGSIRHDDYSDFGGTTNPNIGLTLTPVEGLKIFAHWNKSFNAPTAIDNLAIATGRFACGIYVPGGTAAQRPNDPLGRDTSRQGSCALVLQGSAPGLKPQTANSWAVGFEATPLDGLRFGANFYSIDLKNALGNLNPANQATYTTNPDLYTYNLTAAQYSAILAGLTNGGQLGAQQVASNIAIVVDTRTGNLNAAKLEGVDFTAAIDQDTRLGRFGLGLNGTLATRARVLANGVAVNQLNVGQSRFTATTYLAWSKGPLSSRITVNYSGKARDEAGDNLGNVDRKPFTLTNVNFGYDFSKTSPLSGLSLRLIVDNVFDVEPERVRRLNTNNPPYFRWTLGRVIKLGATFQM